MRRSARRVGAGFSYGRGARRTRIRERVAIVAFALGVLVAIVGLAFAAGYIVGKLIL